MKTEKIKVIVYIPMRGDILHPAIINVIDKGAKLGEVIVGLLTDKPSGIHSTASTKL